MSSVVQRLTILSVVFGIEKTVVGEWVSETAVKVWDSFAERICDADILDSELDFLLGNSGSISYDDIWSVIEKSAVEFTP
jgi:hypothetical protein